MPDAMPTDPASEPEVARWPATVAVLLVGGLYLFISGRYAVGPSWLVLAVGVALVVPFWVARRGGRHDLTHRLALAVNGFLTIAVAASATLLILRLGQGTTQALALLRDAVLIWAANILTFALWYWTLDAGGPAKRHPGKHASTDFAFPQQQQDDDGVVEGWSPGFLRLPLRRLQHRDRLQPDRHDGPLPPYGGGDDGRVGDLPGRRRGARRPRDQHHRELMTPIRPGAGC